MLVMCLNGWGGTLHAALIPYIAATRPDVLCLQEVVHSPATTQGWLTYRDGDHVLPQRANLFAEVAAALPGHRATFCPAACGTLWDGDIGVPSFWGLATFVAADLPVIGQAQGCVHGTYSPDGFGDHPRSRSAHGVRIHNPATGRTLTITHMHGLRDLSGKHDTPERLAQAERLAGLAASVAGPGDDLVVCGDFNVLPDSATFDVLGRLGVCDLVTGRGHDGTRTSQYTKPGKFADYMCVSAGLSEARFEVIRDPEVSDHCPLVLTI